MPLTTLSERDQLRIARAFAKRLDVPLRGAVGSLDQATVRRHRDAAPAAREAGRAHHVVQNDV